MPTKKTTKAISTKDLQMVLVTSEKDISINAWIILPKSHPDYSKFKKEVKGPLENFESSCFNRAPFFPEVLIQSFDQNYMDPHIKKFDSCIDTFMGYDNNEETYWDPPKSFKNKTAKPKTTKGLMLVNILFEDSQAWTLISQSDPRLSELKSHRKKWMYSIRTFDFPNFPDLILDTKDDKFKKIDYQKFFKKWSYAESEEEIDARILEEKKDEKEIERNLWVNGEKCFNLLSAWYKAYGLSDTTPKERLRILLKDAKEEGGVEKYIQKLKMKKSFWIKKMPE